MKCRFCAETIQDEAIVCRFCGAERDGDGVWQRRRVAPVRAAPVRPKGYFSLQFVGLFWILSAVFEAFSATSEVPLFGALRGGVVAWGYHLGYVGLFGALAWSYMKQLTWGHSLTLVATLVVTADRTLYLLDGAGRGAELSKAVGGRREVFDLVGEETFQAIMIAVALITLLSWWGLAGYVHYRRAYFERRAGSGQSGDPGE